MSVQLELPARLEKELTERAARLGLSVSQYVQRLLDGPDADRADIARNGAELLSYWRAEGVIGSRTDIADSQEQARAIRKKAEQRERP